MYQIIGGDGKEYGPVTADQLRQWVREGRANAQSSVKPEGGAGWQALGTVPELGDLFAASTSGAPPPIGSLAPATAGSGPVHDGDYDLDIGGCMSRAWAVLTANFWLMVGGGAVYLLIIGGISGMAQIPIIGALFSIVSLIITGPLLGGLYFFILRVVRGQRAEVGDVFAGFRDNLGQLILGYIVPALIVFACVIPGIAMMAVPIVLMAKAKAASAALIAIASIGFVLVLVPATYLSVCWGFTLPLIMDKRLEFWPAMKASRAQVRRHWWTVFGFTIIMGLINLAGMLACCIGIFVSMPLAFGALMCAYETLFTPRAPQPGPGA